MVSAAPVAAWSTVIIAVALAFGWTLGGGFAGDDFAYVGRFHAFSPTAWPRLFVREWSEGLWGQPITELRPVAALSFIIDGRLWGAHPLGYHLTNLTLHGACSGLVMLIARRVIGGWRLPLVAGLLFAVHPVHDQAVIWVTGRVDVLPALGFLLGFYAYLQTIASPHRKWLVLAWTAYGMGVFAKESCLTLPIVAWLYGYVTPHGVVRQHRTLFAGWMAIALIYLACRFVAFGGVGLPLTADRASEWMAGVVPRMALYMGSLIWPKDSAPMLTEWALAHPWWMAAGGSVLLVAVVVAGATSGWCRLQSVRTAVFFVAMWPVVTLVPLVITYPTLRHVYTASAGAIVGAVMLLSLAVPSRSALVALAAGLIALCGLELGASTASWRDAQARSGEILRAVSDVGRVASPGQVVLLDVPDRHRGRWLWANATPFALRPPFQSTDLAASLIVLQPAVVHYSVIDWPDARITSGLEPVGGWLITSRTDGPVETTQVSAAALGQALRTAGQPSDEEWFTRVVQHSGGQP